MAAKLDKSEIEYNNQLDAFELYHLITENANRPSSLDGGPALPALGHALAGSVATATSKLIIYPLDLVIARLQVQKQLRKPSQSATSRDAEYKGLLDAVSKIYRHEGGIPAFYTGCLADVSKGIADSFLFFLAYSFLQQYELKKAAANKKQISVAKEMGIGIAAGAFAKLFTTPLQNIITRQQTAALLAAPDMTEDGALKKGDSLTIAQIAKQIYRERGLVGFWRGYSLSLILTLNPAITFAVDHFLQSFTRFTSAGAHVTFLIAAVSKALATSITYPVSVAKSRAQAMAPATIVKADGEKSAAASSSRSKSSPLTRILSAQYAVYISLQNIYKQEGLSGLYSGLEAEVLKGFLSHGLTMMVKDRVHHSIIKLYYLLLRATKQWPAELRHAQALAASVVVDARQRVENVGVTVVEGSKSALSGAKDAVLAASHDAGHRADNVGTTIAEASKHALSELKDSASGLDLRSRADNVGTTAVEGGHNLFDAAKSAVSVAQESVSNIGTTFTEAGKHAVGEAQSATNSAVGELANRADNVSTTLMEGGRHALSDMKSSATTASGPVIEGVNNVGTTVIEGAKNVLKK